MLCMYVCPSKNTMKVKIVIKLPLHNDRDRSKAMKIAVQIEGVNSVSVGGKDGGEVVVIGDKVDSVLLATSLRKKFCFANIESVEEVKPDPNPNPPVVEPVDEDPPVVKPLKVWAYLPRGCYHHYYYPNHYQVCECSSEPCSIM